MSLFSSFALKSHYKFLSLALAVFAIGESAAYAASWTQNSWSSSPTYASSDTAAPKRSAPRENPTSPFSPGSNNISLDVGQVFLMGDLGDKYSDSIGSQLHYTYGVSEMFGFDASAGYSNHADGDYSMMNLLAGLRTNLAWYDKVVPYFNVGLGFYKPSEKVTSTTSLSPMLFGLHIGPGVDLELTKTFFFGASLTFHDIFGTTKQTALGPKEIGGTYTSFYLRAGVTF